MAARVDSTRLADGAIVTAVAVAHAVAAVAALAWPVMHVGADEREAARAQACDVGPGPRC